MDMPSPRQHQIQRLPQIPNCRQTLSGWAWELLRTYPNLHRPKAGNLLQLFGHSHSSRTFQSQPEQKNGSGNTKEESKLNKAIHHHHHQQPGRPPMPTKIPEGLKYRMKSKAPHKKCSVCGTSVAIRKTVCPCGFEFPKKAKPTKQAGPGTEEVEVTFDGWKIVPARSRKQTCGMCRTKMKGGMKGWHTAYSDGDSYWWCERCETDANFISPVVTTTSTVEELKAAWMEMRRSRKH